MNTLFLDTETFSPVPITHGTHAYAEQAEVMLVPYAWNDEPVTVWDTQDRPHWRDELQTMIEYADEVVIHNSQFDRTVLRHCGVNIPVDKITDTMVIALMHSLPASLGMLCDVLGVPQDTAKDKAGKKLIQLLTKPRPKNVKLRRATRETHPDEWQAFIEYARLDVDAMRAVYRRLPRWNCGDRERNLWLADQAINDRGVAVDRDLARSATRAFERTSRALAARTARLTNGAVASLTQRQKLLDYLAVHHNFVPDDMTKGTVTALLKGDLGPAVRELLEIRQQASATSPAKYTVILNAASSDGRLRGTIQFCGASRTGRDAGRVFQPQNLPRPSMKPEQIEGGIAAMKLDCEDLLFDNVSELCSSAVRGCLVAAPGRKLVVADLSNIEGRVLAWLAGEDWKVKAFYDFDRGVGHDLYKITAGRILGKDPGAITKDERQLQGKVPELAGGYGGGIGAYRKMGGAVFDAMTDDAIQTIVHAWRKQHPATVALWYAVERAAKAVLADPSSATEVRGLRFDMHGSWLRIRLPSGRYLSYPNAALEDGQIWYDGICQFTKQWKRLDTYYGKLCIAQGTPVLTDAGWVPIERVTSSHRVWDGEDWVPNEGLARKGAKEVICLNGIWMTPDHEVLTTEGWVRASQSEGLERADPRIPAGRTVPRKRRSPISVVASLPVREGDHLARNRDNQYAIRGTQRVAEVYDLVNCGPRRRFVVAGEDGDAFLVHNCENAVQAIARDIFMGGMLRAEQAGYPVVIRVHDELICETPDEPAFTVAGLSALMTRGESWTTGLPLAAAGHEMFRYAKLD